MEAVKPKKSDKYIPYYFVAFFIFLAMADGVFVYLATSTHTGVVKEQAYEKGLDYNNLIDAKAAQDTLNWKSSLTLQGEALTATLSDAENTPLKDAKVTAHLTRPTQGGYDFSATLTPQDNKHYTALIDFPLKGQWDATLIVLWNQHSYQKRTRLIVQ
ncbi:MAG: FixH family protein [Rickettsiales bacterium]|nr:FixH family protein [Rickettsiales bacterium]